VSDIPAAVASAVPTSPSRRTVTKGLAWSLPAATALAAAPTFAASCNCTAVTSCLSKTGNYRTNGIPGVFTPGSGYIYQPLVYGTGIQANGTWQFTDTCASSPYANWTVTPVSTSVTWRYTSDSGYPTGTSASSPTKTYTTTNFTNVSWNGGSSTTTLGNINTLSSTSFFAGATYGNNIFANYDLSQPSYPVSQSITLRVTNPADPTCSCLVTVTDSAMPLCGIPTIGTHSAVALGWIVWWVC